MTLDPQISLRLSWHIGRDPSEPVPSELFALLQAIDKAGSLSVATRALKLSYRHAWGLLRKWGQTFGSPLVVLERGRGASLSTLGQRLLWLHQWADARVGPELDSLASDANNRIREGSAPNERPMLRIFGSHGFAVELLQTLVAESVDLDIDLQFRGGLAGLRNLQASKCDLAGFHLPEGPRGVKLGARYLPYLDPPAYRLIRVARRRQGLIVAADNPNRIRGLRDLSRTAARFINRQPGSGTRLLFDLLLTELGIEPRTIEGYSSEEFTHMAVAAMVRSGAADAGFGIEVAARRFGLHFIPLAWEPYLFAVKLEMLASLGVQRLLTLLRDRAFRHQASALPGYTADDAGELLPIQAVFQQAKHKP
jgi:putative molybdopterin biosynthesis protein